MQALHARRCLDVCPTGSLFRTEFGTVVVQQDICNGCGYCVPACPFGVLDKRHIAKPPELPALHGNEDGRVWKCTLCYDRLKGGHEPACAKACPTQSIQFGPLDELRERADARLAKLDAEGWNGAQLYGRDPDDGVGGFGAFFLLLDEPGGLRPAARPGRDDEAPRRDVAEHGDRRGRGRRRHRRRIPRRPVVSATKRGTEMRSYYGRPVIKEPTWTWEIPLYFFTGGVSAARRRCSRSRRSSSATSSSRGRRSTSARPPISSRRRCSSPTSGGPSASTTCCASFKVTSPMNVGAWVLLVNGGASNTAAVLELAGRLQAAQARRRARRGALSARRSRRTPACCSPTRRCRPGTRRGGSCRGSSARARRRAQAQRRALFLDPDDAGPARRLAVGGVVAEGALMQR